MKRAGSPSLRRDIRGGPRESSPPELESRPVTSIVPLARFTKGKDVKWVFIYRLDGASKTPIYIGQTVNDSARASAHQRETSKCIAVANEIRRLVAETPDWTFSANFHRVEGIRYGVPGDKADLFEEFFIQALGTKLKEGATGCNQNSAPHAADNQQYFPEIREAFAKLKGEEQLYMPADRLAHAQRVAAAAEGDRAFVEALVREFEVVGEKAPTTLEECFDIMKATAECANAVRQTHVLLRGLDAKYKKLPADDAADLQAFAQEWNEVKSCVYDYIGQPGSSVEVAQSLLRGCMQTTTRLIVNGEESDRSFTVAQVREMVECALVLVVRRDRKASAASPVDSSFDSHMAWTKLGAEGRMCETPQRKLQRVRALLQRDLTDRQREKATERMHEIERAVRNLV